MNEPSAAPLPASRPLRILAIAAAAALLTGLFVYLGFPYDRLATRIAIAVEETTGVRLVLGPVGPDLGLLGPGIAIGSLRASLPDGEDWSFERVTLRPAWSTAWLSGTPAVFVDAAAPFGRVRGVATLADTPGFEGEGTQLDLGALLARFATQGGMLAGTADVRADVRMGPEGPEGPIAFSAQDGTLSHPQLPMDVPYERIDAELRLGGEALVEILSFEVTSPMGTGSITGKIGQARAPAQAPLDLRIEVDAAENIQAPLRAQGVRFGRDGKLALSVRGTLARPVVR